MDSRIARTIMCRLPFAVIPTVHTVHYCTLKGDQRPHSLCMYYYRESKMQKLKIIQEWFIKALQFCWQVFLLVSNIPDSQVAPCQKYIRGLVLGGTCKINSGISPTFLLFLRGLKSAKFGLWDALFLKWNLKPTLGASMIDLSPPQIWCRLLPHISEKNLQLLRLCWNVIHWCIISLLVKAQNDWHNIGQLSSCTKEFENWNYIKW